MSVQCHIEKIRNPVWLSSIADKRSQIVRPIVRTYGSSPIVALELGSVNMNMNQRATIKYYDSIACSRLGEEGGGGGQSGQRFLSRALVTN